MATKKKFYKLDCAHLGVKSIPYASGCGPLPGGMPFLSPELLESKLEFWKINPRPEGMTICGGRRWTDFIGNGGGGFSFCVSERVLTSLRSNGFVVSRATEIPIAQVDTERLRNQTPPRYYVIETAPGIEVDFVATGIPVDRSGRPVLNPLPRPWPPRLWWLSLKSWTGADLFCYSNYGDGLCLVCTEKVVELAKAEAWTNCSFDPVWAA
jgi:hypothetical protein